MTNIMNRSAINANWDRDALERELVQGKFKSVDDLLRQVYARQRVG